MSLELARPWALLLLGAVPLWVAYLRRTRPAGVAFSRAGTLAGAGRGRAAVLGGVPEAARSLAFVLLTVALAGPRAGEGYVDHEGEGLSIMLVVDVSSSMLAEDFQPQNRLGATKQVLGRFVQARPHDRIGLVAFAGEAATRVPPTVDHALVTASLDAMRIGELQDGTAIGEGIAAAANRLRQVPEGSRVIVLMSDGENNRGVVEPLEAARAAAALGIRIYAVGVGSDTTVRVPVAVTRTGLRYAMLPVSIDEPLLTAIADVGGGRYFRARDAGALGAIYQEIDRLETAPIAERRHVLRTERYLPFLLAGAAVLLLEALFRATRWGRLP
jgi:Ca-activated chloride channel homolog